MPLIKKGGELEVFFNVDEVVKEIKRIRINKSYIFNRETDYISIKGYKVDGLKQNQWSEYKLIVNNDGKYNINYNINKNIENTLLDNVNIFKGKNILNKQKFKMNLQDNINFHEKMNKKIIYYVQVGKRKDN